MSYLLSGLDLVVNNTTSIVVNTNQTTVQGDIATSENVIAVSNQYNRFSVPDNAAAATIKSTSKATSLTGLTAKALGTVNIPIAEPVGGNGLKNLITNYYDSTTYYSPQLLTCVGFNNTSTTIEDLSDNNFTITNNGTAIISVLAPFSNSYAYASVLFNGTTQYLSITGATSDVLNLAANAVDWTVECWFYPTSVTGERTIFWKGGATGSTNPSYAFFLSGTTGQWIVGNGLGGGASQNLATVFAINTWYHFALVRTGNTLTSYVNGVGGTPVTMSFTMGNTTNNLLTIGSSVADGSTRFFAGNISNFHVVKNVAVYKGNFTPPKNNFLPVLVSTLKSNINTTTYTKLTYLPLNINLYNSLKYTAPTGQQETYDPDLVGNSRINSYVVSNLANKHIKSDTEIVNVSLSPEFYINGPDAPIVLSTEGRGEVPTILNYVANFNGGQNLTLSAQTALSFGTGDFTVELWVYPTNVPDNIYSGIIEARGGTGVENWTVGLVVSGPYLYPHMTVSAGGLAGNIAVPPNIWTHVAWSRQGSILKMFVNGVQAYSASNTLSINANATQTIGRCNENNRYYQGYMSNLRIVKGVGVYTGNFTVPIDNLTKTQLSDTNINAVTLDTQTTLLLFQSPQLFIDKSVYTTSINNSQNIGVKVYNIFPTTTLITPVRGGGSFNGTTATLTSSGNSLFNLTTNDFTLETWIYYLGTAAAFTIMGQQGGPSPNRGWIWSMGTGGDLAFGWSIAGNGTISSGGAYYSTAVAPLNQWNHIALVRSGSTYTFYINGVAAGSGAMSGAVNFVGPFGIGYTPNETTSGQSYFKGSMSNIRIVNGVAVYTGNFTVPTKPLTKEQNASTNISAITTQTVLLTLQNSLTLADNSNSANTISNVGGVTIASTNSPVWTPYPAPLTAGGFKFNGVTSEYYTLPALNTVFQFGTGDFTIELWVYITKSQTGYIYDTRPTTTQGAYATLYYSHTNGWISYDTDSFSRLTAPVSLNRWYHVAVVKSSGSTKMYLNGTQSGSSYSSGSSYLASSSPTVIGAASYTTGAAPFAGYISNMRVVKGLGVYTGNFTVPTSPLTKTQTSSTNISAIVGGFTSLLTAQDGTKLDYSDNAATISSSVNSVTPSVLYGPVLGTVSTAATVNSSPGAYVSTPPINTTNIEYINYRTDPRSVNKRVKNLIVGTTGVLEELQSWS